MKISLDKLYVIVTEAKYSDPYLSTDEVFASKGAADAECARNNEAAKKLPFYSTSSMFNRVMKLDDFMSLLKTYSYQEGLRVGRDNGD